ncbi:single-stranded DNA-binding protein [Nonomuraea harbinensis]|uniref:Single-stranded DNA-binding protein n=1 Tax=Nonomuraea harbinensis TaxID=1286938 RepID=A0ABW1C8D9_9ACTN|nr:single-stranded DNA-binding protein [Nonomuraea harbinensis]
MSIGDTPITVVGNLTDDPSLNFSQQGVAVASFTIASSRRVRDQATGEWSDGDTLFLRCSAFRKLAENCAESLTRGCRAVVTGRLKQRTYEDREGIKRTVFEVEVEDVGPSLKWASAKVVKIQRDQVPAPASGTEAPPSDPWAVPQAPVAAGAGYPSTPPF